MSTIREEVQSRLAEAIRDERMAKHQEDLKHWWYRFKFWMFKKFKHPNMTLEFRKPDRQEIMKMMQKVRREHGYITCVMCPSTYHLKKFLRGTQVQVLDRMGSGEALNILTSEKRTYVCDNCLISSGWVQEYPEKASA